MTVITKSAKRHPAAKKCCGWEKPAICIIAPWESFLAIFKWSIEQEHFFGGFHLIISNTLNRKILQKIVLARFDRNYPTFVWTSIFPLLYK